VVKTRLGKSPVPVYYRLQNEIRDGIERGRWKPGVMIPPERVFVEEYGVSIGTVKKAISNLVTEGFLYRLQGKGTFVTDTQARRNRLRYYRMFKDFTDSESNLQFSLLEISIDEGSQPIRKLLHLQPRHDLFRMKRILTVEGGTRIYAVSYLSGKLFKDLDKQTTSELNTRTLYTFLEETYDVPTLSNQELIGIVNAEEEVSNHLDVSFGTPLLLIEMLAFTYRERPYEYRLSYCHTENQKVFRVY